MYKKERSSRETTLTQRRRTPSFSSTLLDSIYRSIDESSGEEHVLGRFSRETNRVKKQSCSSVSPTRRDASFLEEEKQASTTARRAVMIESWTDKRSSRGSSFILRPQALQIPAPLREEEEEEEEEEMCSRPPKMSRVSKKIQVLGNKEPNHFRIRPKKNPKCEGEGFAKTKAKSIENLRELEVARGAAAGFVRSCHRKKNVSEFDFRGFHSYIEVDGDSDSDDESCSSSDLFELDHLIGIGRYREELPVYETTNFKTNQSIANGFLL
ncbi:hypothetical protein OIU77_006128 [Salix suchowensis]|uniref:Protein BIG GRAIN 1-like B n=1 Tax=Salix suchowensis TaxID=1278906 RepID=A0ABQ9ARZ0_9ROSI|nr:hypothetical protein OIU77_006128 [Salix suchowensis]